MRCDWALTDSRFFFDEPLLWFYSINRYFRMFHAPKSSPASFDQGRPGGPSATIIARGVRVEGEFASEGDVLIEGEVHGTLKTSGMLTIGPEAKLKAEVTAGEAVVAGSIEGNITVERRLELKGSSRVHGDMSAETISVEAGASLTGRVAIGARTEAVAEKISAKRMKVEEVPAARLA